MQEPREVDGASPTTSNAQNTACALLIPSTQAWTVSWATSGLK